MPEPFIVDQTFIGGPNDDEDDPTNWKYVTVPSKYEICDYCRGEGKSSAYLGAFSPDDMYEYGPDFVEDYFSGFYDKPCPECKGERVIRVPDRENADPEALKMYDEQQEEYWKTEQLYRMEMSMYDRFE